MVKQKGPDKVWRLAEEIEAAKTLAAELKLSPIVANLLLRRDVTSVAAAKLFLRPDLAQLHTPKKMKGIATAVTLITDAIAAGDKICIYGDFDCDGVTSTALLYETLMEMGADAYPFIPNRFQHGYGLNSGVIKELAEKKYRLIVTVDNGIANYSEIEAAKKLGVKVIVTDHHQPPPTLPAAEAIVNPRQPGCAYPFKDLAGVGVAFKLAQALAAKSGNQINIEKKLDLVAIGTVADIVPLLGENRVLVTKGLELINTSPRPGIAALKLISGLRDDKVSSEQVSYLLAPRFNAAGRMSTARYGLKLLLTGDRLTAKSLALELNRYNQDRQNIENKVLLDAISRIEKDGLSNSSSIVLASATWHEGVSGIVASRLIERYNRPTILFTEKDGVLKGSGRSIPNVNIFAALSHCRELLIGFGGHQAAVGVRLKKENLTRFTNYFNSVLDEMFDIDELVDVINVDAAVELDQLSDKILEEIEELEPFGKSNPMPKFVTSGVYLDEQRRLGKGENLRFLVRSDNYAFNTIGFRLNNIDKIFNHKQTADIVYQLGRDRWKGDNSLQLRLVDIKLNDDSSTTPSRFNG